MSEARQLCFLDRVLTCAVLETTVDQLAIVYATLPRPRQAFAVHPNTTEASLEQLLVKENKLYQSKKNRRRSTMASMTQAASSWARQRLAAEAIYAQKVLEQTTAEVVETGTWEGLRESVARSKERQKERERIRENEKSVRREIGELKESIESARHSCLVDVEKESLRVAHLKDALLEARRTTRGEEDYVRELETVKEEERTKRLEDEEHKLLLKRDELKRELEHEQRVTLEMESWLNDRRDHLRALHRHWNERLRSDLAQADSALAEAAAARVADGVRRTDTERRLKQAKEFVRSEKERREQERRKRERFELEVRTAVRIQAWWRMTMVRQGLGPFRKKVPHKQKQQQSGKKKASTIR